ncbi:MAG: hypothetical protein OXK80_00565 [Bdellovibrionales bacterium]|nr:hypothetical protein [Bdellovibrionales bacterium]
MKKWLLMAILCLSVAGCDWFKSDSANENADATSGDVTAGASDAGTDGADDDKAEESTDDDAEAS